LKYKKKVDRVIASETCPIDIFDAPIHQTG
jgi:hypothetical protein